MSSSSRSSERAPLITRRATRSGLPPLRDYISEAWRFRTFAAYWSKADLKSRNFDTRFGQFWHYLNPLLFGLIYFAFVGIISGSFGSFGRLGFIISNLYVWSFLSATIVSAVGSIQGGAGGVTGQSAIPRAILPFASMLTALSLFLRSMVAYIPIHFAAGRTIHPENLWLPVLTILTATFALGIAMVMAVGNVYFRDLSRLLPHMLRLWMYLSPVVWEYTRVGSTGAESLARFNPMFPVMAMWTIAFGGRPQGSDFSMVTGVAIFTVIAVTAFAVGFLVFVAREDDFAVRN